jgi:hypothetical protein
VRKIVDEQLEAPDEKQSIDETCDVCAIASTIGATSRSSSLAKN